MDFELSADQVALQDAARDLLDGLAGPATVRKIFDDGSGFDRDLWQAMVEQGWTALMVPESLGGLGFGTVELAVLLEQVGAHVAPVPFLQHAVALGALVRAADVGAEGTLAWVEQLSMGEKVGCVAWNPVEAEPAGDGRWSLTGTPEPVVYAPSADLVVLRANAPDGEGLFLVEIDHARPEPEPAMDRTRQVGWVHLESSPAFRIGDAAAAEAFIDLGATAYSAELLGASAQAMDMAVEYAKERQQFGKPIGSFQAVKHRCADMLVDVEGMRSAAYYAAWAIGADDPEASIAASTAKTWCSDASKRVMASALQVHGGIGFTWEHDLHFFLKRAQLDQVSFGDAAWHRARLAARLRARVEAGDSVI